MNNKIICISKSEALKIKEKYNDNKNIFLAEIYGEQIKNEEQFVQAMAQAFVFFDRLPQMKLGWYNDCICDLMWIEQETIVLIIYDYDKLLSDDIVTKKRVMEGFIEVVLPWWDGDVIGHMVGGKRKKFTIFVERE